MKVYTVMEQAESLSYLNRHVHEVLGCAPAIILMIFFCKVKIFPLLEELPAKIFHTLYVHTAATLHCASTQL